MRETLKLLYLSFAVKVHYFNEWLKIVRKYYPNRRFCKADLLLRGFYLIYPPFKISKNFLCARGDEDLYTFGETPLTTLDRIAKEASLTKDDIIYDLGCATGRTSIWLRHFIGCQVIAIEYIPAFIKHAEWVKKRCKIDKLTFLNEDMLEIDYEKASAVYLYGSCFEEEFLKQLINKLRALKPGAKVISVSYPLEEFSEELLFEVTKTFSAKFTWGEADVYIQKRI
jgi:SAM-dependent methyltransferase